MNYLNSIITYRDEILFLSVQNIKKKYLGTAFGTVWAVIQPFSYILTFWIFFTVGLRGGDPIDGISFMLLLISGVVPWRILSEMTTGGTNTIISNKVLVTTIKFPVMSLPLIEVLSQMYILIILTIISVPIFMLYGQMPTVYYINFLYYWFAMIVFMTSLTFLLSSISIVLRDIKSLIKSLMTALFWLTPVLWIPVGPLDFIVKVVNPYYYFINGYRETLLYDVFFWEQPLYDIYFWLITLFIFFIGIRFFNKIRPIMADII